MIVTYMHLVNKKKTYLVLVDKRDGINKCSCALFEDLAAS